MKVREQFRSYHNKISLIEFFDKLDVHVREIKSDFIVFALSYPKDASTEMVISVTVPFILAHVES